MLHAPISENIIEGGRRRSEPMVSAAHRPSTIKAYGNQAMLRTGVHRAATALRPSRTGMLQCKCACGAEPDRAPGNGLAISDPGDAFEQEADRVADQVMRMSAQQAISGEEEKDEVLPTTQAVVFRKAELTPASAQPAPAVMSEIAGHGATGEPLPATARGKMESAFGYDFSRVRVHRDARAAEMSRQINALAFTFGSDVYFGRGMYDPDSASGGHLLAHELTHVVQQGRADRQGDGAGAPAKTPAAIIQRTATWDDKTPANEVNDLVDTVLFGKAAGDTWPTLNGSTVKSAADALQALDKPTAGLTAVPAAKKGAPDEYDATVDAIGNNTGSFDEAVLKAGPWIRVVPKATVGAALGLPQCTGQGDSTFTANGSRTDKDVFDANRRHEDHHVADDKLAFLRTIGSGDAQLSAAKKKGTKYHGKTQADATAALHKATGGTPTEITAQFAAIVTKAGKDFHNTAAGGKIRILSSTTDQTCSISSAKCFNPG
jgi:hypothetical protein